MELHEKLLPFVKEHGVALFLGIVGVICLGYGVVSLSHPQTPDTNNDFAPSKQVISSADIPASPVPKQITIDIEGSVEKPGVYKIPEGSRMQDALIVAGGLAEYADRQVVAQNFNLAAPLTDGSKMYIPAVGEQMVTSGGTTGATSGNVQGAATKAVNINQATEEELDSLPGVGPVTAQKIIANRPYHSVQELLDKKAVGQSVFGKIKDQVTVY